VSVRQCRVTVHPEAHLLYIYGIFCRRRDSRLAVGFSASCLVAFPGSSAQKMASCMGVATPIVGTLVVVRMCHVVCHPGDHVSLNIIEKISLNPKIFTETRTQFSFRDFDLRSCNLVSETKKCCLGTILLLCLVLELHKTSSGLEPRTVLGVLAFVSVISSSKQIWSWRRSSVVHSIRATKTIFTGNRTQDNFFGLWFSFL
jgi:hypothetical protein